MLRKIIIASTVALSGSAFAAPPAQFVREAIQGNYSEVTLGRLIQNRSSNPQVRKFGAILVRDHSHGLAEAQAIAARLRLRIAATLTPQARRELVLLRHLNGRAFDREVRRYMVDDHQKDIAEFRAQVRSGDRMENMIFSNLVMTNVTGPIYIGLGSAPRNALNPDQITAGGIVRNIQFRGIRATVAARPDLTEFPYLPGTPISDVYPGEHRVHAR